MVLGITAHAASQIRGLLAYYLHHLDPPRPAAAHALLQELREARAAILAGGNRGKPFPATYGGLARYGFLWLRIRSYWVSWAPAHPAPIITNVFYATAQIERRASPSIDDVTEFGAP